MRIRWNERVIGWFADASRYTGFHRKLAELLIPYIPPDRTLCDLGCGLGLIDLELTGRLSRITCVDLDRGALDALESLAAQRGAGNLEVVCRDCLTLTGQWDTVLSVFYGRGFDLAQTHLPLCREKLIAVVHGDTGPEFGPRGYHPPKRNTGSRTAEELDRLGIVYERLDSALEYGQPFRSRPEAAAFVKTYGENAPERSLDAYLDANLKETGNPHFPWYLPNRKKFSVFIIGRECNCGKL